MASITVELDDARVLAVLDRIAAGVSDPTPLLKAWGEDLAESTKQRFASSTAPDGSAWPTNSQATFEAYLAKLSGSYSKEGKRTGTKKGYLNKDGRLAAKGITAVTGKKPLIGLGKSLSTAIYYRVDGDTLYVGSPQVYAAMQQFGGSQAKFPNLWGDIPARPFLGLSDQDVVNIEKTAVDYLSDLANG